MRPTMISVLLLSGMAAGACGKLTIQVKKEAKNSSLQSGAGAVEGSGNSFALANPEDFLKELDGLRKNAASIIVKQLASQDYVGKFRAGIRSYRKFLLEKSQQQSTLSDSFYTDPSKECRENVLSLNIDKDNQVLGMILETALLAKIGEANVGKLNAGLTTELQALVQFITIELGVDITGTSSVDKIDNQDVSRGQVSIKLLPISGEKIDEATKAEDASSTLSLNFERRLGDDSIGTFHADMRLESGKSEPAVAVFDISRSKESDHYVHIAEVKMGSLSQPSNYSRQIVVADIPNQKLKFNFTDILNAGQASEASYDTIIDVEKGTQCKVEKSKGGDGEQPSPTPTPDPSATPTPTPTPSPTSDPGQNPNQSPDQGKGKK